MRKSLLLFVMGLLPVMWSLVHAEAGVMDTQDMTREILERSGWMARLAQFPGQTLRQLHHTDGELSYENVTMLKEAVTQAYNVDALEMEMIEQVAEALDERTATDILVWFRSPLGEKVGQLENRPSNAHLEKPMEQFFEALASHPPTSVRVNLIRRLSGAMNSTELGAALAVQAAMAVTSAFNATRPAQQQINVEEMKKDIEAQQREMTEALEVQTIAGLLFLYHGLTDEELGQYVRFMESHQGQHFQQIVRLTLMKVLKTASQQMGQAFGEALQAIERREGV